MQSRRLAKVTQGIPMKLVRPLYITVCVPRMLYAVDVWMTLNFKPEKQRCNMKKGIVQQMEMI